MIAESIDLGLVRRCFFVLVLLAFRISIKAICRLFAFISTSEFACATAATKKHIYHDGLLRANKVGPNIVSKLEEANDKKI